MADELDTVISNLATVLEGVEGIKVVEEAPLEGYSQFPMAVVWLESSLSFCPYWASFITWCGRISMAKLKRHPVLHLPHW